MNKIRKINSSKLPRAIVPSPHGPEKAGVDYDVSRGLVVNPDGVNPFVIPNFRDHVESFDDFLGDVLADRWNVQAGSDGACTAAITAAQNGVVRLTTGADEGASMATNGIQFEGILNWKPSQKNLVLEARLALGSIADVAVFVGLTDQVAALEMPATLSGTTFTTNATDAVGLLYDTAATTDTWRLVGVASNVDAAHYDTGKVPVANTYETFRIEVSPLGVAKLYRNGAFVATLPNAVTPSVALVPVIAAFSRTNASKTVDVDYIHVSQSRS